MHKATNHKTKTFELLGQANLVQIFKKIIFSANESLVDHVFV